MCNSLSVAAVILRSGMDVDVVNKRAQTAMTCAVFGSKREMINFLLDHGADVNKSDGQGNTYLHLALVNKDFDIASMLIQAGADVDIANDAGITARKLIHSSGQDALLATAGVAVSH